MSFGAIMFGAAARRMQTEHGSRAQYERLAQQGTVRDRLGAFETGFLEQRDSFYLASVTEDGWPYVQHRGGKPGFLRVLDDGRLAFADYAGNKQYITAGNLETNDRVALIAVDYPERARLKVIGHARTLAVGTDQMVDNAVLVPGVKARVERIIAIDVVAFDWNCSQHLEPRWTRAELESLSAGVSR